MKSLSMLGYMGIFLWCINTIGVQWINNNYYFEDDIDYFYTIINNEEVRQSRYKAIHTVTLYLYNTPKIGKILMD